MAQTYTPDRLDALMAKARDPTAESLASAATHVQAIFRGNSIPYAFMGGYSLLLRGNGRHTNDIDIAVGSTMQQLKKVCLQQARLILPAGPVAGVMRVFVATGGQWDDSGHPEKLVETDLMLAGNYDVPANLQAGMEIISALTPLGTSQFPVLNLQHALATKLSAFYARRSPNDYNDIRWLCTCHYIQIATFRAHLNVQHRQAFIQACQQQPASSGGPNFVKRMKNILAVA